MIPIPPTIPQIKFKGVEDIIDKSCVLNFMPMRYGKKMIDLSGHNNHGTITGATQMHPPGSAMSFDGVDDKIDCLHPASIFLTNNFTWEIWFKPEDLTHNEFLMSWYGERFSIRLKDNSGYRLTIRNHPGNDNIWGDTVLQAGQWYHLVVTKSSVTGTQIYLNGVSEGGDNTTTGNIELVANDDLWLGMDKWAQEHGWSDWFEGKMDEVRIYSRAITATEAREHYEGKFTNNTDLELHYTFYTQTGNTVYDLTANDNDGTRTGATWTTVGRPKPTYVLPTLYFDGADDIVDFGSHKSLTFGNAFTIETWIYPYQQTYPNGIIFAKYHSSLGKQFMLSQYSDSIRMYCRDSGSTGKDVKLTNYLKNKTAKWVHIVATWDGTTMKIYGNGEISADTETLTSLEPCTDALKVGGDYSADWFKGCVPEGRILRKAISAEQVKRLFEWRRAAYNV